MFKLLPCLHQQAVLRNLFLSYSSPLDSARDIGRLTESVHTATDFLLTHNITFFLNSENIKRKVNNRKAVRARFRRFKVGYQFIPRRHPEAARGMCGSLWRSSFHGGVQVDLGMQLC